MRRIGLAMLACALALGVPAPSSAQVFGLRAPHRLAGTLIDYTANRGADYRIWSPTLGEPRDLYVYLPPGYDPAQRYPVLMWLHGIAEDENTFPTDGLRYFDDAIACGRLPPLIIVMPDGSRDGRNRSHDPRPLFLNSNLGAFEDFVVHDVWDFVTEHYSILPDRQAHIIGGYSGGGAAAFRIAIRHRDRFGVVFAGAPPLNVRWVDCHGRYFGNFNPDCWGWRTDVRGHEVVGRFGGGIVTFRLGRLVYPLYGKGPQTIEALARENPIELLDSEDVRPGELAMLVAYGGKDQFNIDAQVESFIYRARERGLEVDVCYAPHGRHNLRHYQRFFPEMVEWVARQLTPDHFSSPSNRIALPR